MPSSRVCSDWDPVGDIRLFPCSLDTFLHFFCVCINGEKAYVAELEAGAEGEEIALLPAW